MKPIIYAATSIAPAGSEFIGQFVDENDAIVPILFRWSDENGLRAKMLCWLEAERIKAGVTAEKLEQRRAERAARRAKRDARSALAKQ